MRRMRKNRRPWYSSLPSFGQSIIVDANPVRQRISMPFNNIPMKNTIEPSSVEIVNEDVSIVFAVRKNKSRDNVGKKHRIRPLVLLPNGLLLIYLDRYSKNRNN
ncbi:MAG: hypothetical protein M1269_03340 [Chloroflexi bacterium]|nr:hypothetical protein [Chloroflexota bacterium]